MEVHIVNMISPFKKIIGLLLLCLLKFEIYLHLTKWKIANFLPNIMIGKYLKVQNIKHFILLKSHISIFFLSINF